MYKLIQLEIKKFKLSNHLRGMAIANLTLLSVFLIMGVISVYEGEEIFMNFSFTVIVIDALVRATFIIYSSVILSSLVIEEYIHKTINVMFMYPIKRSKIIMAKFIIVVLFAFVNIIISNLFITLAMGFADSVLDMIPGVFDISMLMHALPSLVISAVATAFMTLIPIYFGVKKMSISRVIVVAVLLVALTCSVSSDVIITPVLSMMMAIGGIGLFMGWRVIKRLEHQDVL